MKSAKLGVMFLVSLMALAGTGVAFSAWTDTITIAGQVDTGSVSWEITGYSGTYVYKDLGPKDLDDIVVVSQMLPQAPDHSWKYGIADNGDLCYLVSWCYASAGTDDHNAVMDYDNLFPLTGVGGSPVFCADITIKYTGSIPGKINNINFASDIPGDWLQTLINKGYITAQYYNAAGDKVGLGYQLHCGDTVTVDICIIIPQDNTLMSHSGSFSASLEVIQWNEYVAV